MFTEYEYIYIDSSLIHGSFDIREFFRSIREDIRNSHKLITVFSSVLDEGWNFAMEDSRAYSNMRYLESKNGFLVEFTPNEDYDSLEAAITDRVGKHSQLVFTRDGDFAAAILKLNERDDVDSNFISLGLINKDHEIGYIKVLTDEEVEDLPDNNHDIDVSEISVHGEPISQGHQSVFNSADEVAATIRELKKQIRFLTELERKMRNDESNGGSGLSA